MWYGVTRFFIEGLRTDSLMFLGLRMAQIASIIFVIVGLLGYFGLFRKIFPQAKPIILWDFDGTLADSESVIIDTFKALFAKHKPQVEVKEDSLHLLIGETLENVMFDYYPGNHDTMIQEYRALQQPILKKNLKEKPSATHVLQTLRSKGYTMGVVSNRSQQSLEQCIKHLEMTSYFDVVIGHDLMDEAKPSPSGIDKALEILGVDKGAVVYVGDTSIDVKAGRRAGSFTIACIFDTIREHEINESKPNRIVKGLDEVLAVLEEDVQWTTTMM